MILNNKGRKILCLFDKDITAIEILEKDIIRHKVRFLNYNKKSVNYLNIEVFIFHHPNGEKLQWNKGKILDVGVPKEYEFEHNLFTQKGSSGSSIIYFRQSKEGPNLKPRVIGIHNSYDLKTSIGFSFNTKIGQDLSLFI